jgi:hypothetical protein
VSIILPASSRMVRVPVTERPCALGLKSAIIGISRQAFPEHDFSGTVDLVRPLGQKPTMAFYAHGANGHVVQHPLHRMTAWCIGQRVHQRASAISEL